MATTADALRARTKVRRTTPVRPVKTIRARLARLVEDGRLGPDPQRLVGRHLGARC
jgi:hypothetical protein